MKLYYGYKILTRGLAILGLSLLSLSPAFADPSDVNHPTVKELQDQCYGDNIGPYIPGMLQAAKAELEDKMVGNSIHLADRNRFVLHGVKSVKWEFWYGCSFLKVTYNVTLERTLRQDATGTAIVHYGLQQFHNKVGKIFIFANPDIEDYDLSHLTGVGENWWSAQTPESFFLPLDDTRSGGIAGFGVKYID